MEEQQRNIDEAFRQSLGDYREAPPAAAWEAVRARLDADKGRRRFFAWWIWASLLLLLICGTWLVAEQFGRKKNDEQKSAQRSTSAATSPAFSKSGREPSATQNGQLISDSGNVAKADGALDEKRKPARVEKAVAADSTSAARVDAPRQTRRQRMTGRKDQVARASRVPASAQPSASRPPTFRAAPIENTPRAAGDSVTEQAARRREPRPKATEERTVNRAPKPTPALQVTQSSPPPDTRPASRRHQPAEEKQKPSKSTAASSKKPASAEGSISSPSAADSTTTKSSRTRSRSEKPRSQPVLVAAADIRPKSVPGADSGTKRNKPKTETVKENTHPVPTKPSTVDVKSKTDTPPVATKAVLVRTDSANPRTVKASAAPGPSTPIAPPKGAVESIAAAGVSAVVSSKALGNPASRASTIADDSRGAPGIPVLPDTTPVADSPATRNPSLAGGGGGGGGVEDDEDDEEGKDTLANPSRKKQARFSLTPLAGYEFGTQSSAPSRLVGSLRFQMNFGRGWSVGVEPAYRSSTVKNATIQQQQTFQRSSPISIDSFYVQTPGTVFRTYFYYIRQDFDSIVVPGATAGGKLWEMELPLTIRYTVPRTGLYLYGGPTMVFGGKLTSSSGGAMQTYALQRRDTVVLPNVGPPYTILPNDTFQNYFSTSSLPPISSYDSNASVLLVHPSATRFGYAAGIGYDWRRVVLDVSIHKQVTGFGDVNALLRDVYASPYVRVSVGYRLGGRQQGRKKRPGDASEKYFLQRF